MQSSPLTAASTYTNPVYPGSFPDPFVLRYGDEYFAFCTGFAPDGRVFGVLHSNDLINWRELDGAMDPLPAGVAAGDLYWAPEVTYADGKFYLYYGVGNETLMQIRVATSREPAGPYLDSGRKMTDQDFAIDPHVFIDDDGSWHMFYATDFLNYSHIGTGTVVDRMHDPLTLAGDPRPVTRAKYDWQIYDAARKEKGGVRWHTVEGPFVLKRKGKYFEMFSAGNWQNTTYGVGYAVSDSIDSDREWVQQVDGTETLPLLRTTPDKVIGPGHNSVVVGPNGGELFCVYHRWQDDKRVMCVDRMDFAGGNRMFVTGPSSEPQRIPYPPSPNGFEECFEGADLMSRGWSASRELLIEDRNLFVPAGERIVISKEVIKGNYELAVNLRVDDTTANNPSVTLDCGSAVTLHKDGERWFLSTGGTEFELPAYRSGVFHQLRIVSELEHSILYFDGAKVGVVGGASYSGRFEMTVEAAAITVDMVRYTTW